MGTKLKNIFYKRVVYSNITLLISKILLKYVQQTSTQSYFCMIQYFERYMTFKRQIIIFMGKKINNIKCLILQITSTHTIIII